MSKNQYQAAHNAVRKAFGKASTHRCVTCGEQAHDWALKADPVATTQCTPNDGVPGWWSPLVTDYEPKCQRCHREADAARQSAYEAQWEDVLSDDPYLNDPDFKAVVTDWTTA